MYFATIKGPTTQVAGRLPLTADEALTFIEQSAGTGVSVEIRDEHGNVVTAEQLRNETRR